jgi:hypothetical protein
MPRFLGVQAEWFRGQMEFLRLLPPSHRVQVAEHIYAEIWPYLSCTDVDELRELRRYAQDQRAILLYEGARDLTHVRFAGLTLVEQWARAKIDSQASQVVGDIIFAERRLVDIEAFVQDNFFRDSG